MTDTKPGLFTVADVGRSVHELKEHYSYDFEPGWDAMAHDVLNAGLSPEHRRVLEAAIKRAAYQGGCAEIDPDAPLLAAADDFARYITEGTETHGDY